MNPILQAQFVGPFRVSKAYCNHTYRLDGYRSLVSQSRLKLYHDSMAGNPVRVPAVRFSSPSEAERQTELSDHGEDNPPTDVSTGNPTDGNDKADQPGHVSNPRTLLPDQPNKKGKSVRGADKKQAQPTGKQEPKKTSSRIFINTKLKKGLPSTSKGAEPVRRSQRKRSQPDRLTY